MLVSGHKSVQSLSIYQKIYKKQKIKMGKVLFGSMSKENTKKLTVPQEKLALPVPQLNQMQAATQNRKLTVTLKQNVTEPAIPFDKDISIPDIDLLSAMCRIEQDNTPVIMSNSVANTSHQSNTKGFVCKLPYWYDQPEHH